MCHPLKDNKTSLANYIGNRFHTRMQTPLHIRKCERDGGYKAHSWGQGSADPRHPSDGHLALGSIEGRGPQLSASTEIILELIRNAGFQVPHQLQGEVKDGQ